mmetsp:Transcript_15324/g.32522  ORF Transcript_15324/g.32522 Transcript_15324/m.32522 type:complete len:312 (-) Transcript_15324:91-1026(-)
MVLTVATCVSRRSAILTAVAVAFALLQCRKRGRIGRNLRILGQQIIVIRFIVSGSAAKAPPVLLDASRCIDRAGRFQNAYRRSVSGGQNDILVDALSIGQFAVRKGQNVPQRLHEIPRDMSLGDIGISGISLEIDKDDARRLSRRSGERGSAAEKVIRRNGQWGRIGLGHGTGMFRIGIGTQNLDRRVGQVAAAEVARGRLACEGDVIDGNAASRAELGIGHGLTGATAPPSVMRGDVFRGAVTADGVPFTGTVGRRGIGVGGGFDGAPFVLESLTDIGAGAAAGAVVVLVVIVVVAIAVEPVAVIVKASN